MESCSTNTVILHCFISFSSLQYKQKLGNSFLHLCKRKSSEVLLSYEANKQGHMGSARNSVNGRKPKTLWYGEIMGLGVHKLTYTREVGGREIINITSLVAETQVKETIG